ncbi:MAG: FAD-binding oxidoreductase, partial [Deltaproteobacteria bacterium]|nr:FAD-binding oxidoreductase [Deltaproteobacteria bacterium]
MMPGERAEVVVVGAGLAGCSVAWHLAPSFDVLVLDQADQPGVEASAQNAGMVRRMGEDPWERALALRTVAFLEDPGADWADLAPSRKVGAVMGLARDPTHFHDATAHLRARGVRVEVCDRPGEVAPALRDSPLQRAWYLPDERVADAHALLTGFLRGARRHGARVRCGERVLGLRVERGRVVGVDTASGPVAAGCVVLATGAWSAHLAQTLGLHRPLVPLARTLLQSAPHPLSHPDHPWSWIDDVGIYVRPETGGWLCSPCDETVSFPAPGPGSRGPVDPYHRALAT